MNAAATKVELFGPNFQHFEPRWGHVALGTCPPGPLNGRPAVESENQKRYLSLRALKTALLPRRASSSHLPLGFLLVIGALLSGCASQSPLAASSAHPTASGRIVAIHRTKCGACHTPVEPGSIARDEAEAAMERHHRRVRLTERDFAELVDYLSNDKARPQHTAQNP